MYTIFPQIIGGNNIIWYDVKFIFYKQFLK